MSKALIEDLVGEVVGLRALLKATILRSAIQAGDPEATLKELHELSHRILRNGSLTSPGLDSETIRARSEHVVDQMLGTMRVRDPGPDPEAAPSAKKSR